VTGQATVALENVNGMNDNTVGPFSVSGAPLDCVALAEGRGTSGTFAGVAIQLDAASLGDIAVTNLLVFRPWCPGDCNSDTEVTVNELVFMVSIALGEDVVATCTAGDRNTDGTITIDEIILAVNAALSGCVVSTAEQGCLATGGTVTAAMCCLSTGDFPDTCAIGACGCAPSASHEVRVCDCGAGSCFDGSSCVRR
jgi:hypothetical protein